MEKMNDIEFIKGCVPFADGFKIERYQGSFDMIELPHDERYVITSLKFSDFINDWDSLLFPLLLTRTIEGINREKTGHGIVLDEDYIKVREWKPSGNGKIFYHKDYKAIDDCKRSAIEYVLRNSP